MNFHLNKIFKKSIVDNFKDMTNDIKQEIMDTFTRKKEIFVSKRSKLKY